MEAKSKSLTPKMLLLKSRRISRPRLRRRVISLLISLQPLLRKSARPTIQPRITRRLVSSRPRIRWAISIWLSSMQAAGTSYFLSLESWLLLFLEQQCRCFQSSSEKWLMESVVFSLLKSWVRVPYTWYMWALELYLSASCRSLVSQSSRTVSLRRSRLSTSEHA